MRRPSAALLLFFWMFALACPGLLPAQQKKPKTDPNPLLGTWQVVAVESPELVFEGEGVDRTMKYTSKAHVKQGKRLQFNKWIFKEKEVIKQDVFGPISVPYRLGSAAKGAREIDFATAGEFDPKLRKEVEDFEQPQMCIYRAEGNDLTICLHDFRRGVSIGNNPIRPTRPPALKARWDDKHGVFIVYRLRRVPTPDKVPPLPQTPPEGDAVAIAKNPKLLTLAKQKYETALPRAGRSDE